MNGSLRYRPPRIPMRALPLLEFNRILLCDAVGQEAFRRALRDNIRGGESVLDIGTGTGVHAMFACQAGAARVYAVEEDRIIALAESLCRGNGFGERITFLHAAVQDVELSEKVDVICVHMGLIETLGLIAEVRDRFLRRGGAIIPGSAELFCAAVESPIAHEYIRFWQDAHYELDFSPVRQIAVNSVYSRRIAAEELLSAGTRLAEFDFGKVCEPAISVTAKAEIIRDGVCHGIGLWFVEHLSRDVSVSTAPPCDLPIHLWPNQFFPIERPVSVRRGDLLTLAMRIDFGAWGNLWHWQVVISDSAAQEKHRSTHSTLSAQLFSKDMMHRRAPTYVPLLKPTGSAAQFVLQACHEGKCLQSIEDEVFRRFPGLFRDAGEAAMFVAEIISRFAD